MVRSNQSFSTPAWLLAVVIGGGVLLVLIAIVVHRKKVKSGRADLSLVLNRSGHSVVLSPRAAEARYGGAGSPDQSFDQTQMALQSFPVDQSESDPADGPMSPAPWTPAAGGGVGALSFDEPATMEGGAALHTPGGRSHRLPRYESPVGHAVSGQNRAELMLQAGIKPGDPNNVLAGTVPVSGLSGSVKDHQAAMLRSHLGRVAEAHAAVQLVPLGTSFSAGEANQEKNREPTLLPTDLTRISLLGFDPRAPEAYVNANAIYFPGVPRPLKYLACQGPLPTTVIDTWTMMWQENVELIVNLTTPNELDGQGRPSAERYYPATVGQQVSYGELSVTLAAMHESPNGHCMVWTLELAHVGGGGGLRGAGGARRRTVRVVQALGDGTRWPDTGAPELPAFTELMRVVAVQRAGCPNPHAPVAVHCGSGFDRTGMFILADILRTKLGDGLVPDAIEILGMLRRQRAHLVRHLPQMRFCYEYALASLGMSAGGGGGVGSSLRPAVESTNL
jgi:protein tyrosine phosphatase